MRIALLHDVPSAISERAAGHGYRVRVVVAEPDAGTIGARDARAVPGPRPVGAVPMDLAEIGDPLTDVKDGREGGVPRHVTQNVILIIVVVIGALRW